MPQALWQDVLKDFGTLIHFHLIHFTPLVALFMHMFVFTSLHISENSVASRDAASNNR